MVPRNLIRSIAVGTTAIAVAIGAYAIGNSSSGNGSAGSANAATPLGRTGGSNQRSVGQIPQGWHSGSGTIITGAAADKAKAVAVAKYPGGTVNRVLKLSDGSYAVHQIKISWPHHVFVSKTFKVTGAIG
ncbi:MAG: hypothetical protein QOJ29_5137 [Thermoleophilaceae bacterium]|nr:hypothetical protein [Thermoleophilaceae bacterium]